LILSIIFLFSAYVYAEKRSVDGRYKDLGKGMIKDTKTGMMWTQKDSYVDLGHSLSWNESNEYVNELSSGGFSDWRLPTISELKTLYEPLKTSKDIFGGRVKLDPIFAERGPYSYWSSDTEGSCCARAMAFDYGNVRKHHRDFSGSYCVRAVRQ
jgi:Protein of unknown function (DUF1566)